MTHPHVFVVIVNWNLKNDTIQCLESVLNNHYPSFRVVVVDNGSSDDSVLEISRRFGDMVDIIAIGENIGFAGGANIGIQYALDKGAEWILLLNNDTIIAPDMIEKLMQVAAQETSVGILGPVIYRYDQPNKVWRMGDWHPRWLPIPFMVPDKVLHFRQKAFHVDYVTGCGMLIRREVFCKTGLFDSSYFMYYEDADFCLRAKRMGFAIMCVPFAKMWHKVSKSTDGNPIYQRFLKTKYRTQFYRQYYSWLAWIYLVISVCGEALKQILKGNLLLARSCLLGFYCGWRKFDGVGHL